MKTTRILIADDHGILRDGLRMLLECHKDLEVVGETGDGRSALKLVEELQPGVVIMDIAMPQLNGFEATRQIKARFPDVRILILTMSHDRASIAGSLMAGASAFLIKDNAFDELVSGIRAVLAGHTFLSPAALDLLAEDYRRLLARDSGRLTPELSQREQEVLQLLAEGKSAKDISVVLGVSVKTVESHRLQIMKKLDLDSLAGLTKYAIREGLTPL